MKPLRVSKPVSKPVSKVVPKKRVNKQKLVKQKPITKLGPFLTDLARLFRNGVPAYPRVSGRLVVVRRARGFHVYEIGRRIL